MSRYHASGSLERMLEASQYWKEVALLSDGAVFAKEPVWTLPYLQDLKQYFIDQPDVGKDSFFVKLEKQLEATEPEVKQLAAEMLWVIYLCPDNITKPRKLGNIRLVWEWSGKSFPENSDWLAEDVLGGAGNAGTGFNTNIPDELAFFIRVMIDFKNLPEPERIELLSDGWKFGKRLEQIPECDRRQFRNMIVFLLFPDDFEHIFSGTKRREIVQQFTGKTGLSSALEIDQELFKIRRQREEEYGTAKLDFYASPLYELWEGSKTENDSEHNQDDSQPKADTMKYPLNQILYGPPGTGKTWNTVNHAVAIIEGKSLDEIEGEGREEVKQRFDELKTNGQIAMVTFHQNFTYEDFIEGIRPILVSKESKNDEGSKNVEYKLHKGVFREIVERADKNRTQSEQTGDKSWDMDELLQAFAKSINKKLKSKKEIHLSEGRSGATIIAVSRSEDGSFESVRLGGSVKSRHTLNANKIKKEPDNLYIIGTMNTADRSIALLDTALRRRFDFIEMMPDAKHHRISTDIEGVNCQELLAVMNKRIRFLLDREHQIGHTYFMDIKRVKGKDSLKAAFKTKIIPLLQEYFYDNWEKIDLVLNCNGFIDPQPSIDINLFKNSELIDEERKIYELLPDNDGKWKDPKSYPDIYQKEQGETG